MPSTVVHCPCAPAEEAATIAPISFFARGINVTSHIASVRKGSREWGAVSKLVHVASVCRSTRNFRQDRIVRCEDTARGRERHATKLFPCVTACVCAVACIGVGTHELTGIDRPLEVIDV